MAFARLWEHSSTCAEVVNLARASAWIHQQLIFDSMPLTAAVEEASRYLKVPVAIDDSTLADIRVSGVVRAADVESFVGTPESSFPIPHRGTGQER